MAELESSRYRDEVSEMLSAGRAAKRRSADSLLLSPQKRAKIFVNVLLEKIIGGGPTERLYRIFSDWIDGDAYKIGLLQRKLESIYRHSDAFSDACLHNLALLYAQLMVDEVLPVATLDFILTLSEESAINAKILVKLLAKHMIDSWGYEEFSTRVNGALLDNQAFSNLLTLSRQHVPTERAAGKMRGTLSEPMECCPQASQPCAHHHTPACGAGECGRVCRVICRPLPCPEPDSESVSSESELSIIISHSVSDDSSISMVSVDPESESDTEEEDPPEPCVTRRVCRVVCTTVCDQPPVCGQPCPKLN